MTVSVGSAPPSMSSSAPLPQRRSLWRTPREESLQLPAWTVQGTGQQQGWPGALWHLCPLTSLETDVVSASHQGSLPPLPSRMPTQHQASKACQWAEGLLCRLAVLVHTASATIHEREPRGLGCTRSGVMDKGGAAEGKGCAHQSGDSRAAGTHRSSSYFMSEG